MCDARLPDLRAKLAAAVAFAARRLWRFDGQLQQVDEVVLDLLVEALQRLGQASRPTASCPAKVALAAAPRRIQELVERLEPVAGRPAPAGLLPSAPCTPWPVARASSCTRSRSGTPPARRAAVLAGACPEQAVCRPPATPLVAPAVASAVGTACVGAECASASAASLFPGGLDAVFRWSNAAAAVHTGPVLGVAFGEDVTVGDDLESVLSEEHRSGDAGVGSVEPSSDEEFRRAEATFM